MWPEPQPSKRTASHTPPGKAYCVGSIGPPPGSYLAIEVHMLARAVVKGAEPSKAGPADRARQPRRNAVAERQSASQDLLPDEQNAIHAFSPQLAWDFSQVPIYPPDPNGGGKPVSPTTTTPVIASEALRAPGASLDAATRSYFEPRFGFDLSRVRVHADRPAAAAARSLQARAFTVGPHIVFGADRYAPQTREGRRLLAHELTHVVQQTMVPGDAASTADAEMEAARAGTAFLTGMLPAIRHGVAAGALQREPEGAAQPTDPSLEPILRAAAKARAAAGDPTELTITGAQIVYGIVQAFLPTYADRISGVDYRAAVHGVEAQKTGGSFNISVGKDFILGMTNPTQGALAIKVALGKAEGGQATAPAGHGLLGQMVQQQTTAPVKPQAPAQAQTTPTPEEQKAEAIAATQRGLAKTVTQGGKTLLIGGVTINAGAKADIKAGLLLNAADSAHLGFVGNQLGVDTGYTSPKDPNRWQTLTTIIRDGLVEIQAVGRSETFKVKQRDTKGVETDIDPTLSNLSGNGATALRKSLADVTGPPKAPGGMDFVSLTGADQVFYVKGNAAIGHELFGHVWLAMHGVASGHGENLSSTTTIKDPFGEPFTGLVNDYIGEFVLQAGQKASRTEGVTDATLEIALREFTSVAAKPNFTVGPLSTGFSKGFLAAWMKLRRFYAILVANPVNEAKRLQHITDEIGKVRAALPRDQQVGFDNFMKNRGSTAGAINPEGHVVRTLKL